MNGVTEFPFCLIGKTEKDARKLCVDNDLVFRCIEKDGKKIAYSRDIRMDRMNAAIENDIITRAYVG